MAGTILTTIGASKLASATPQDQLNVTHIAVGDSNAAISESGTALNSEVWRGESSLPARDPENTNVIVFEVQIPPDVGGFTVREIGVFDVDGDLIAIGHTAEVEKTTGQGESAVQLTMRVYIALENATQVDLIYSENPYINHNNLSGLNEIGAHDEIYTRTFNNVLEMTGAFGLLPGHNVQTHGYYNTGDDGYSKYHVFAPADVPDYILVDEVANFTLIGGNVAVHMPRNPGELCVEQYGAKGDVVDGQGTNDAPAIRAALAQAKALAARQTVTTWDTMTGGLVKLGAKNYGLYVSDAEVSDGLDCCLPVAARTGLRGHGRNSTILSCLDGFAEVPVVANEQHIAKGFDDFLSVGGFQVLGRWYHGLNCRATFGVRMNFSSGTGLRTDNFGRFSDMLIENIPGTGVYVNGRGEQAWDNVQANQCYKGLDLHTVVDSYFTRCNAGGNLYAGISIYKGSACKFTNCKSYYNGRNGGDSLENSANWYISGDSYLAGRSTYSQCESQESWGSGFVILCGGNLFSNCISADPKRQPMGTGVRPAHSVCYYLGSSIEGWEQSMAMDNHFQNCMATYNLTTNYADLNKKSYMGDGAVYIEARSRDNTGNIVIAPRAYCEEVFLGGPGIGDNPLLSVMGEPLKDGSMPSAANMFYKNELGGVRVYGNPEAERNHKTTDYLISIDGSAGVWVDPKVSSLLTGLSTGTTYDLSAKPYSYVGAGPADLQTFQRKLTRQAATLDSGLGFDADRPLIDLDAGTIRFSFTVGDRSDFTNQLQGLVYQGDGTTTEMFIALFDEYNLRIDIGGEQIEGLGAGTRFENATFDVVIYPVGMEIYSNGILYAGNTEFIRGDVRADPALNVTKFGQGHPGATGITNLKGQLLGFSTDTATVIFDNAGGNQSVVSGQLDTAVTEAGDFTGAWAEVPLVV